MPALFAAIFFALPACKNKTAPAVPVDVATDGRGDVQKDGNADVVFVKPDVDDAGEDKDIIVGDTVETTPIPDDVEPAPDVQDTAPDVWTPTPCKSHDDCEGLGLCVELAQGAGEYVCAPYCMEECPADWQCKSMYVDGPDPVSLCFPPGETICSVCSVDKDCLFAGSLCVKGGGALGFCGKYCHPEDAPDCPDGFECLMATTNSGDKLGYQCMPTKGHCCVAGKLKNCDDDNPCTADTCEPSFGCEHGNIDGPCEGPDDCTEYKCVNGACIGFLITQDVTKDGIDDDCDGMTDEDWAYWLKVPVYGFSSTAHEVTGGPFTVRGSLSTPPAANVSSGGDFKVFPGTPKVKEALSD